MPREQREAAYMRKGTMKKKQSTRRALLHSSVRAYTFTRLHLINFLISSFCIDSWAIPLSPTVRRSRQLPQSSSSTNNIVLNFCYSAGYYMFQPLQRDAMQRDEKSRRMQKTSSSTRRHKEQTDRTLGKENSKPPPTPN